MSSFNNIDKFVYTKNKDDVVSLLDYIIFSPCCQLNIDFFAFL